METSSGTQSRLPLTRDGIVNSAVALADRDGVSGLTMRKLAKALGFEVMSLYNHVANKNELLMLMADAAAAEIEEPPTGAEPLAAVRAIAMSMRAVFVEHPWAPEIWLQHLPGPARMRCMEDLLRILGESGLSPDVAHHGYHAVNNHVVGYTLQDIGMSLGQDDPEGTDATIHGFMSTLSADDHPYMVAHVQQHIDGDTGSSFELVLDFILDGLARLNAHD